MIWEILSSCSPGGPEVPAAAASSGWFEAATAAGGVVTAIAVGAWGVLRRLRADIPPPHPPQPVPPPATTATEVARIAERLDKITDMLNELNVTLGRQAVTLEYVEKTVHGLQNRLEEERRRR